MKTKLNIFYHRFFVEIQTAVLVLLVVNLLLLGYGIWNGNKQRESNKNSIIESTTRVSKKQDSALIKAKELTELIKNKN